MLTENYCKKNLPVSRVVLLSFCGSKHLISPSTFSHLPSLGVALLRSLARGRNKAKPSPGLHRGKAHFDIKNVTYNWTDQCREELIIEHQALAARNSREDFGGKGGCSEKEGKPDISEIISHRKASTGFRKEAGQKQGRWRGRSALGRIFTALGRTGWGATHRKYIFQCADSILTPNKSAGQPPASRSLFTLSATGLGLLPLVIHCMD